MTTLRGPTVNAKTPTLPSLTVKAKTSTLASPTVNAKTSTLPSPTVNAKATTLPSPTVNARTSNFSSNTVNARTPTLASPPGNARTQILQGSKCHPAENPDTKLQDCLDPNNLINGTNKRSKSKAIKTSNGNPDWNQLVDISKENGLLQVNDRLDEKRTVEITKPYQSKYVHIDTKNINSGLGKSQDITNGLCGINNEENIQQTSETEAETVDKFIMKEDSIYRKFNQKIEPIEIPIRSNSEPQLPDHGSNYLHLNSSFAGKGFRIPSVNTECHSCPVANCESNFNAAASARCLQSISTSRKIDPTNVRSTHLEKSILAKKRVIRMLFVVVFEFFICWTPIFIVNILALYIPNELYRTLGGYGISFLHLLSYASSCCNPITYCFMNRRFVQAFLHVFGCRKVGKKLPRIYGSRMSFRTHSHNGGMRAVGSQNGGMRAGGSHNGGMRVLEGKRPSREDTLM